MGYEVDFLAVGDGERGGDAIALRCGNLHNPPDNQVVMVFDGGTKESGEKLVNHIKEYYKTNKVDYLFLSHPDNDHASGLSVILEKLSVGVLVMHKPWEHAQEIKDLFVDGRLTTKGLEIRIAKSLQAAKDIESLATQKGIPIVEPFTGVGTEDGMITVLGPSLDYYKILLANFRETPKPKPEATIAQNIFRMATEAIEWVEEKLDIETLDDTGETSSENNSSSIVLLNFEGNRVLLTGDAGIPALTQAADYATKNNIEISPLHFWQVPHHGSKHNVGPTILDRLQGNTSFISVPQKGDPKHPSRKVTNALNRRRKDTVHATKGTNKRHHNNAPNRDGWTSSTPVPFYSKVES